MQASWSPNGAKILFIRNGQPCLESSCRQIYTVNSDGTGMTQLSHSAFNHTDPTWSPDGAEILFAYNSGAYYACYVMNADGGDEHEISNHAASFTGDLPGDWQPLIVAPSDPAPSLLGLNSAFYMTSYPRPQSVEITVTRSGNLNETVSCDYRIVSNYGSVSSPLPNGTFTFAPGEHSKTIQFSYSYSAAYYAYGTLVPITFDAAIYNNWGNATFVGGVKHARIIFVSQNANAIDNQAYFVRQQYRDFLGREPDASGWDFWVNHMDTCPSGTTYTECQNLKPAIRVDTSAAFFLSIEFQ